MGFLTMIGALSLIKDMIQYPQVTLCIILFVAVIVTLVSTGETIAKHPEYTSHKIFKLIGILIEKTIQGLKMGKTKIDKTLDSSIEAIESDKK